MIPHTFLVVVLSTLIAPAAVAAETILGVYIFSRHGDRTSKSTPPTNLTSLGYAQVYASGQAYRARYVASDATSHIAGLSPDLVQLSQLGGVTAPQDNVLMSSAVGFLQGMYPPVGNDAGAAAQELLRNGTAVPAPLDGYQIVPVQQQQATSGGGGGGGSAGTEDTAWLQGASGCANAALSSNAYYTSLEYQETLDRAQAFYDGLRPFVNRTFTTEEQTSFRHAYAVFDLLNVASVHNSSEESPWLDGLTDGALVQARTLADAHEFGLAFNASDRIRAVAGQTLAGEVLEALNRTVQSEGKTKLTIEFGAYASFLSFFGLAQLPAATSDFYGLPDYASSMAFELFTDADVGDGSGFPAEADLRVRFLFHNGSSAAGADPTVFPLFGGSEEALPWADFRERMGEFAIADQVSWCRACGNTTGVCAGTAATPGDDGDYSGEVSAESERGGHEMSRVVAGVIGAMVTLAVILGLEAVAMLAGGFRLVSKKRLAQGMGEGNGKA